MDKFKYSIREMEILEKEIEYFLKIKEQYIEAKQSNDKINEIQKNIDKFSEKKEIIINYLKKRK